MPHRDDREALDAKLEAQARELAETKEELERLRAANLRKATELEKLRVAASPPITLDPSSTAPGAAAPPTPPLDAASTAPPGARLSPGARREIGLLLVASSVLFGGLSLSAIHLATLGAHGGCHSRALPMTAWPVQTSFDARITRVAGHTSHEAGEACVIHTTFDVDPRSQAHAVSDLSIECGGEVLTAPRSALLGDAIGVAWSAEEPGQIRYELAYDGASASVRSWDGTAVVEGNGTRIELEVAPLSAPVAIPLALPLVREGVVVRTGHVTESTSVPVGSACVVARRPTSIEGFSHRVVVRCAGRTIYGDRETGYTYPTDDSRLDVDDAISTDDGDPRMTLDLARGAVHVEDGSGLDVRSADIALDPTGPALPTGPTTDI